jgi:hypothetical protein
MPRWATMLDPTPAANVNGLFGTTAASIASLSQLRNDYSPTYEVLNINYMVWYDYTVIKLSTLCFIGLTRKADIFPRPYINTGTINVIFSSPNTATPGYTITAANSFTGTDNSFTGTCPFTFNYMADTSANGGIPATVANITVGLYLARPLNTSLHGVNVATSGASHPLSACRLYYSQITLQPSYAEEYISNSRVKNVFIELY